jgi:hypothetical protein
MPYIQQQQQPQRDPHRNTSGLQPNHTIAEIELFDLDCWKMEV